MKIFMVLCIVSLLVSASFAQNVDLIKDKTAESNFNPHVSMDIQAQKLFLGEIEDSDNLDQLFGRANFGMRYNSESFNAGLILRSYPAGFGYSPLIHVEFDDWDWVLKEEREQVSKIQVLEAWAQYVFPNLSVKIGRFNTDNSVFSYFGNYLDLDPDPKFLSHYHSHNALMLTNTTGPVTSSIMLGVGDEKLNRGYLRIHEEIKPTENLTIALGYRSNIFDRVHFKDQELSHRMNAKLSFEIVKGLVSYLDLGIIDSKVKIPKFPFDKLWDLYMADTLVQENWVTFEDWTAEWYKTSFPRTYERTAPLLLGMKIPTGGYLDLLALEVQFRNIREASDGKKLDAALFATKSIGERTLFSISVFSNPESNTLKDLGLGLRFSSLLM